MGEQTRITICNSCGDTFLGVNSKCDLCSETKNQTTTVYQKLDLTAKKIELAEKIQFIRMQADYLRLKLDMKPINNY